MARAFDRRTLPPGPRGPWPLTVARFLLRPTRFIAACRRRYGPLFTVRLSPDRTVVVAGDADVARAVFTGDPELCFGPAKATSCCGRCSGRTRC